MMERRNVESIFGDLTPRVSCCQTELPEALQCADVSGEAASHSHDRNGGFRARPVRLIGTIMLRDPVDC